MVELAEYIDKNKFLKDIILQFHCVPCISNDCYDGVNIKTVLDLQPTVDVVEVVRCKDCKKWNANHICNEFIANQKLQGGGRAVFITEPDDFCSFGIRKE